MHVLHVTSRLDLWNPRKGYFTYVPILEGSNNESFHWASVHGYVPHGVFALNSFYRLENPCKIGRLFHTRPSGILFICNDLVFNVEINRSLDGINL